MEKINNKNFNLQVTLEQAIERFRKQDPANMVLNSKCSFDENNSYFTVPFLNKNLLVGYPEGRISFENSDDEVPITWKILALHYLVQASGKPLTNNFITYKELSGGSIYYEPFKKRAINPMIKFFGETPWKLAQIGEKFGGIKGNHGDCSITINLFPNVPITYVIWKGDDEFPPNATILFDETAGDYLHTEDYAIGASLIVCEMAKLLK